MVIKSAKLEGLEEYKGRWNKDCYFTEDVNQSLKEAVEEK